jgi:hypothetical protein
VPTTTSKVGENPGNMDEDRTRLTSIPVLGAQELWGDVQSVSEKRSFADPESRAVKVD